jgi:hypothetical protein
MYKPKAKGEGQRPSQEPKEQGRWVKKDEEEARRLFEMNRELEL